MIRYLDWRSGSGTFSRKLLHPHLHAAGRVRCEIRHSATVRSKSGSQRLYRFFSDRARLTAFTGNDPDSTAAFKLWDAVNECYLFSTSHPHRIANEWNRSTVDRELANSSRVYIEQRDCTVRPTARRIRRPKARECDEATIRR